MTQFKTYQEMQAERESGGHGVPQVRERGSRLDPGELEEIELTAGRGGAVPADQVLGLVETVRALARRCGVRFQETQELRAKLTDRSRDEEYGAAAFTELSDRLSETVIVRDQAQAEVARLERMVEEISARDLQRMKQLEWQISFQAELLGSSGRRWQEVELIAEHPDVSEILRGGVGGDFEQVDRLSNALREVRQVIASARGDLRDGDSRQEVSPQQDGQQD